MEDNGAISSVKLNKNSSTEGFTFNLCKSLNHFMALENSEIETSHFRNVCIIESLCPRTEIAMVVACNIKFFKFLFGNDYPV